MVFDVMHNPRYRQRDSCNFQLEIAVTNNVCPCTSKSLYNPFIPKHKRSVFCEVEMIQYKYFAGNNIITINFVKNQLQW
jgi:hypothetical protein